MKRQNRVQINKSAALILALALIMGNLSGCSMWSASEDKYNIPVVEENTLSTSSRIYFDTVFDTKGICTIIDGIKRYRTIIENMLILQVFPRMWVSN